MKKILLALMIMVLISGCSNVRKIDLDSVINIGVEQNIKSYNEQRVGYKYYLPRGMRNSSYNDYNEIIKDDKYTYYLYVDVVSYVNKVFDSFKKRDDVFYSEAINYKDRFGYLEIKKIDNEKYLVEIMYNYAKIEVIVNSDDINTVVFNSITVLSSVNYNEIILKNLMGDNILQFKEVDFNIFEPKDDNSTLKYDENVGNNQEEDLYHDTDLID